MTLLIHSAKTETGYSVKWAMKTGSASGIHNVAISHDSSAARECSEIQALSELLKKYPGKAGCVQSSNGLLKKLLLSDNPKQKHALTELGSLKITHPSLNVTSDKKTMALIQEVLEVAEDVVETHSKWVGLGRPRIVTSVGEAEVTVHAMERYRERFAQTGTVDRFAKSLSKPFRVVSEKMKAGKKYSVYRSIVCDFMFVVAEDGIGTKRITTCYHAA